MSKLLSLIGTVLGALPGCVACAQGTLTFATRVTGNVDAQVTYLDGTPVTTGFYAQLWAGPGGTPLPSLTPQFPITTFRDMPPSPGYVNAVIVTIPGVPIGGEATVVMRAFNGASWETSACGGESLPVTVLTGGGLMPPGYLVGLQPFSVDCIPEPSPLALFALAAGGMFLFWRVRRLDSIDPA